jgi:glycosyltransferase involved in cell wall biosynthesis
MKKLTLTIGIPAYNEGLSIGKLLESIFNQKGDNFILEKVVVRSDGSTDNTDEIVKRFSKIHPQIELISDGVRLGLSGGLSKLCRLNKSEVFIAMDADCDFGENNSLEKIMAAFKDPQVGLVSPNVLPKPGKNLIEKAAVAWIMMWYECRKDYLSGDNVNNHFGCVSAMRKDLAKKISIPKSVIGTHDFIYFSNYFAGYKYKFIQQAHIYYSVASTLADYVKQTSRHHGAKDGVVNYFGKSILEKYDLPKTLTRRVLAKNFLKNPIFMSIAILLQIYLRKIHHPKTTSAKSGTWELAMSTK